MPDTSMGVLQGVDPSTLSPKHRAIAHFVSANPSFVSFATAAELAEKVAVSESTVVRFSQDLGFASYKDFRQNLRHRYLGTLSPIREYRKEASDDRTPMAALRRQVVQDAHNLQACLDTVREEELAAAVDAIDASRTVLVISAGSYASVAHVLVHVLRFLGIAATVEDRAVPNLTAAVLPLDERDLVIGISFWRSIRSTADALDWAQQRGVRTLALTDTVYSRLARIADHALIVPTESFSFYQSMAAPLALVYAIGAHLGASADERRQQVMSAGADSFEFFKPTYEEDAS
jgi:DNA-binding MurR/RpiR family transcriptional regulator